MSGMMINLVSFTTPDPESSCPSKLDPSVFEPCSEKEACERIERGLPAKVSFDYPNWTEKYGMFCGNALKRESGRSVFSLATNFSCTLVLLVSDLVGRKRVLWITMVLVVSGSIGVVIIDDFYLKMVCMGIMNSSNAIYAGIFSMLIAECTFDNSRLRNLLIVMMFCSYPVGSVFFNLISFYSRSYGFLAVVCLFASVLGTIFSCIALKESPLYLFEKKVSVSKIMIVLNGIRRINTDQSRNKENQNKILIGEEKEEENLREALSRATLIEEGPQNRRKSKIRIPTVIKFFTNVKYIYQFLILSLVSGLINSVFFGIIIKLGSLSGFSITINGIFFAIIELVSTIMMIYVGQRLNMRRSLIGGQSVLMGSAFILVLFAIFELDLLPGVEIAKVIISIVIMGGTMYSLYTPFYQYISELYPADVRGTANSLITFGGMILATTAPFVSKYAEDRNCHFLAGCCVLGLASLPLTFLLQEKSIEREG